MIRNGDLELFRISCLSGDALDLFNMKLGILNKINVASLF